MGKYRMYSLVLRQLSPMQKGVQAAHSIMEYSSKYHKLTEFIQWASVDKTIIILDGGTHQELKTCRDTLDELHIPYSTFYEEDLGGLMTSISFVVEDKVWDYHSYPDYDEDFVNEVDSDYKNPEWLIEMGGLRNLKFRKFLMSKRLSM